MSLLVVGASGYIGSRILSATHNYHRVFGTSSSGSGDFLRLDLRNPSDFDYGIIKPSDVVLLTAAVSSPDICARDREQAWALNVAGTSEFITKVMALGGRIVFFSSDTVYGEKLDEFTEQASCNPAGEYAEMKHHIENRFLGTPLFKSIRLSYVFSREDKLTKHLSACMERGEEVEVFHPFYRAIIHRNDVVAAAIALARRWDEFPHDVINFGGPQTLSRIEFAETLRDVALPSLSFRATTPDANFFKNRPRVIRMTSPILESLLERPAHTLCEAAMIEFNLKKGEQHD